MDMLKIDIIPTKGILCIKLKGKLNKRNTPKFEKEVTMLIKKAQIKNIVFNIKQLDHIDKYGLKTLKNSLLICHLNKGKSFICLNNNQKELLKINNIKHLKTIEDEITAIDMINS